MSCWDFWWDDISKRFEFSCEEEWKEYVYVCNSFSDVGVFCVVYEIKDVDNKIDVEDYGEGVEGEGLVIEFINEVDIGYCVG